MQPCPTRRCSFRPLAPCVHQPTPPFPIWAPGPGRPAEIGGAKGRKTMALVSQGLEETVVKFCFLLPFFFRRNMEGISFQRDGIT